VEKASAEAFDLILMDIRMPGMGGLAATRELRRRGCLTPIIALTASVSGTEKERIAEAGFDDFWGKPIALDDLIERSAAFLDGDVAGKPKSSAPRDARVSAMNDVRRRYAEELPVKAAILERALRNGDGGEAGAILHQLLGSSAIIGFPEVSEAAAPMYAAVKREDLREAIKQLAPLKAAIASACAPLASERRP
jgi:CheY-like chemotaxis protein